MTAIQSSVVQYRPLNRELYGILQRMFGTVKVASPGEGFQANCYRDVNGRLRYQVHAAGEYYRVCCCYCNDTRYRLWINHMYGARDADGHRIIHLAHCYKNDACLSQPGRLRDLEERLLGFQNRLDRQRGTRSQFQVDPGSREPVGLRAAEPPGVLVSLLDLPSEHKAVQYLMGQRGYTPQMVAKYSISYCVEATPRFQTAADRIIFPIWFNNMLIGWQARFIGDIDWAAAGVPKYYTLPNFHKRLALYNYDVAKQKQFVVLMEGMTDVHALGDHGVAMLGKSLAHHQRLLLLNIGPGKPIVLMLDPEAREEMEGIVAEMLVAAASTRNPIVQVDLPGGLDPGDYHDRMQLWNIVQTQALQRGAPLRFTS